MSKYSDPYDGALFVTMCTDYAGPKPEQKAALERKLRQEITGFVPRARIRPTDPAPLEMIETTIRFYAGFETKAADLLA